jgi:signal peptidase I
LIINPEWKNKYRAYSKFLISIMVVLGFCSILSHVIPWFSSSVWQFYLRPILWLAVCLIILLRIPRVHPLCRISKQLNIYFDAILCAMIFIATNYITAFLVYEVGETPYDLSPRGILINFITVILPFLGFELIRGYVISTYYNRKKKYNTVLFMMIIVTTLLSLNYDKLTTLHGLQDITLYLAQDIAPELSKNMILSYLALYGGAAAAILYGGLLLVFHWFFPILPKLDWLAEGVIGIMTPMLELLYIIMKYGSMSRSRLQASKDKKVTLSLVITLILSVTFIWFIVGVFPVYPSVIATGSMKPLIDPGDVVLVKKFQTVQQVESLKAGDIIAFKREDIVIVHRIIEVVYDDAGNMSFVTKGDNNSTEDIGEVQPNDLKGKYVTCIPKIGYPTLWLKSGSIEERDDVVN